MNVDIEMPKYRCHKIVWALKIKSLTLNSTGDGTATLVPEEERYAPFEVSAEYMTKHQPQAGGYYVVYPDGYKSFSPAAAFEDGYEPYLE